MEIVNLDSQQSPYFVNATDLQAGAIVAPELSEGNYASWRRSFELTVSIKNKMGFIDGTISKPAVDSSLFRAWKRCDDLVRSWLQKSVSPAIASTIFYLNTAREIWEELQERYGEPDDSRVCRLQLQYHSLVQGNKSISGFYNEMLGILRELREYRPYPKCKCGKCDCGWKKAYAEELQKDMVYKFLNGLNREYSALRSQILLRKPFPTLGEAYNILQREELQQNMKGDEVMLFGNPVAAVALSGKDQETMMKHDPAKVIAFAEKKRIRADMLLWEEGASEK